MWGGTVGWVSHEIVHFIANAHTMATLASTGLGGRDLSIVDLDEVCCPACPYFDFLDSFARNRGSSTPFLQMGMHLVSPLTLTLFIARTRSRTIIHGKAVV